MSLLKKCISIMATGALAASLFAGMTFTSFADAANPWDGTYDTSWYSSSGTTFTLSDEQDLAGLAYLVNNGTNFTGKTINLNADIYLNATSVSAPSSTQLQWTPIGGAAAGYSFKGIFDGQNHTIYNIYYNETSGNYSTGNSVKNNIGLFGKVEEGATVCNVNMSGGYVAAQRSVGSIAGKSWGTIHDCCSNVTVYSTDKKGVGGICGANWVNTTTNPPEIYNCCFCGTVTAANNKGSAGGIAGENEGQIYNCCNCGTVTSNYNAGGIVGSNKNDYNKQTQTGGTVYGGVTNSYNVGSITGVYAGGIVGYELGSMRNVYSIGTISGTNAGQLIGELASSSARTHNNLFHMTNTTAVGVTASGAEPITTTQFSYASGLLSQLSSWVGTSTIYSDWDTDSTIHNGYPYLVDVICSLCNC